MSYKLTISIKPSQEKPLKQLIKALANINLSALNPDADDYPAQVAAAAAKVAPDKQTLRALQEVIGRNDKELFYCDEISVNAMSGDDSGWVGLPEECRDQGEFYAEGEYTNYDILTSLAQHVLRSGSPAPYAVLYEWDGDENTSASQAIITSDSVTWYDLQCEQRLHCDALKKEPWLLSAESAADRLLCAAESSPDEKDTLRRMVRVLAEAAGVSGRMRALKDGGLHNMLSNIDGLDFKP
ncbi:hypothetical protein [Alcanivorax sp. 1008]|uniref:hypothetical protein n=1 Tax=Alcanivorax sp. 1008 TaxID=2816853 RepID=UPI001D9CC98C|nr:hypothetical protein [Alcanivorax sp. 1008]MCC1496864.1 hypothetical protein [Alcanivorax sp. 1008]